MAVAVDGLDGYCGNIFEEECLLRIGPAPRAVEDGGAGGARPLAQIALRDVGNILLTEQPAHTIVNEPAAERDEKDLNVWAGRSNEFPEVEQGGTTVGAGGVDIQRKCCIEPNDLVEGQVSAQVERDGGTARGAYGDVVFGVELRQGVPDDAFKKFEA